MSDRALIGGITNTVMHIETDGTIHLEDKQDVEPILHYAQAARDHRFSADACGGMLRHEAEIPFVIFQDECKKAGCMPFSKESDLVMERILVDPKYARFRASPKVRDPRIIMRGAR